MRVTFRPIRACRGLVWPAFFCLLQCTLLVGCGSSGGSDPIVDGTGDGNLDQSFQIDSQDINHIVAGTGDGDDDLGVDGTGDGGDDLGVDGTGDGEADLGPIILADVFIYNALKDRSTPVCDSVKTSDGSDGKNPGTITLPKNCKIDEETLYLIEVVGGFDTDVDDDEIPNGIDNDDDNDLVPNSEEVDGNQFCLDANPADTNLDFESLCKSDPDFVGSTSQCQAWVLNKINKCILNEDVIGNGIYEPGVNKPLPVESKIRLLITGEQIAKGNWHVTALTEYIFSALQYELDHDMISIQDIIETINWTAKLLLSSDQDLNKDGAIDWLDVILWDPTEIELDTKLNETNLTAKQMKHYIDAIHTGKSINTRKSYQYKELVKVIDTLSPAKKIVLDGNISYIATENAFLIIERNRDNSKAKVVGSYPTGGIREFVIKDNFAFLALDNLGFLVLDISNIESPENINYLPSLNVFALQLVEDNLYVIEGTAEERYDYDFPDDVIHPLYHLSEPKLTIVTADLNLQTVASLDIPETPDEFKFGDTDFYFEKPTLTITETKAYVKIDHGYIHTIDISSITDLVAETGLDTTELSKLKGHFYNKQFIVGNRLYSWDNIDYNHLYHSQENTDIWKYFERTWFKGVSIYVYDISSDKPLFLTQIETPCIKILDVQLINSDIVTSQCYLANALASPGIDVHATHFWDAENFKLLAEKQLIAFNFYDEEFIWQPKEYLGVIWKHITTTKTLFQDIALYTDFAIRYIRTSGNVEIPVFESYDYYKVVDAIRQFNWHVLSLPYYNFWSIWGNTEALDLKWDGLTAHIAAGLRNYHIVDFSDIKTDLNNRDQHYNPGKVTFGAVDVGLQPYCYLATGPYFDTKNRADTYAYYNCRDNSYRYDYFHPETTKAVSDIGVVNSFISVYSTLDLETPLCEFSNSTLSNDVSIPTECLDNHDGYFVITSMGGLDFDKDDNDELDESPSEIKGTLHSIVSKAQLLYHPNTVVDNKEYISYNDYREPWVISPYSEYIYQMLKGSLTSDLSHEDIFKLITQAENEVRREKTGYTNNSYYGYYYGYYFNATTTYKFDTLRQIIRNNPSLIDDYMTLTDNYRPAGFATLDLIADGEAVGTIEQSAIVNSVIEIHDMKNIDSLVCSFDSAEFGLSEAMNSIYIPNSCRINATKYYVIKVIGGYETNGLATPQENNTLPGTLHTLVIGQEIIDGAWTATPSSEFIYQNIQEYLTPGYFYPLDSIIIATKDLLLNESSLDKLVDALRFSPNQVPEVAKGLAYRKLSVTLTDKRKTQNNQSAYMPISQATISIFNTNELGSPICSSEIGDDFIQLANADIAISNTCFSNPNNSEEDNTEIDSLFLVTIENAITCPNGDIESEDCTALQADLHGFVIGNTTLKQYHFSKYLDFWMFYDNQGNQSPFSYHTNINLRTEIGYRNVYSLLANGFSTNDIMFELQFNDALLPTPNSLSLESLADAYLEQPENIQSEIDTLNNRSARAIHFDETVHGISSNDTYYFAATEENIIVRNKETLIDSSISVFQPYLDKSNPNTTPYFNIQMAMSGNSLFAYRSDTPSTLVMIELDQLPAPQAEKLTTQEKLVNISPSMKGDLLLHSRHLVTNINVAKNISNTPDLVTLSESPIDSGALDTTEHLATVGRHTYISHRSIQPGRTLDDIASNQLKQKLESDILNPMWVVGREELDENIIDDADMILSLNNNIIDWQIQDRADFSYLGEDISEEHNQFTRSDLINAFYFYHFDYTTAPIFPLFSPMQSEEQLSQEQRESWQDSIQLQSHDTNPSTTVFTAPEDSRIIDLQSDAQHLYITLGHYGMTFDIDERIELLILTVQPDGQLTEYGSWPIENQSEQAFFKPLDTVIYRDLMAYRVNFTFEQHFPSFYIAELEVIDFTIPNASFNTPIWSQRFVVGREWVRELSIDVNANKVTVLSNFNENFIVEIEVGYQHDNNN